MMMMTTTVVMRRALACPFVQRAEGGGEADRQAAGGWAAGRGAPIMIRPQLYSPDVKSVFGDVTPIPRNGDRTRPRLVLHHGAGVATWRAR
jgi:hypothetical protein